MQTNVHLEGELGERFGKTFKVTAKNPSEIFKCIDANRPGFRSYVGECAQNGIDFSVIQAEKDLSVEDCIHPLKEGDISICIVPAGSKKAVKIFAAIVLAFVVMPYIGAAALNSGAVAATSITAHSALGIAMQAAWMTVPGKLVAGLALGLMNAGIAELMMEEPNSSTHEAPENYLFNGDMTNIREGDPVPVLYGELNVPGRPISVDIINGVHRSRTSIVGADGSIYTTNPMDKEIN